MAASARVDSAIVDSAIVDLEQRWKEMQEHEFDRQDKKRKRPVLPAVDKSEFTQLPIAPTIRISAFEMEGSRILDKSALLDLLGKYMGAPISNSVLSDILDTLNTYYAENAYIHSRVSIDESRISDGVIRLQSNEGRVTRLQLRGNKSVNKKTIVNNFESAFELPVNKNSLSNAVTLLKQNPLVSDVHAYLYPLDNSGNNNNNFALLLDIEERRSNEYVLMFNNYLSPSVGAESLRAEAMIYNTLGLGDEIRFNTGLSQGVYQLGMVYRMPLNWQSLLLSVRGAYAQGKIVESVFSELEIENTTQYMDLELAKPLSWQGGNYSLGAGLLWRRQSTEIAGFDWGDDRPETASMHLSWRGQKSHKYFSWQSNLEYVQGLYEVSQSANLASLLKYDLRANRSIGLIGRDHVELRVSGQWALNKIGSLNRFSLGGSRYLRGYRENAIQADSAFAATLEYQLPLIVQGKFIGPEKILFKPFLDFATIAGDESGGDVLVSTGIALYWQYKQTLSVDVSLAYGFDNSYKGEDDLQDYGVQFNLVYRFK